MVGDSNFWAIALPDKAAQALILIRKTMGTGMKFSVWVVLLAFVSTSVAAPLQASQYKPGIAPLQIHKDIDVDLDLEPALRQGSLFKRSYLAPGDDYQLRMIGDRFAAVFTPSGEPMVIFDLTLNPLNWKQILLGSIGFGELTFWRLIKAIRTKRSTQKEANDIRNTETAEEALWARELSEDLSEISDDGEESDPFAFISGWGTNAKEDPVDPAKAFKRGKKFFKKLRFNSEWARRNGVQDEDGKPGVPFELKSFYLSDLEFEDDEMRSGLKEPMILLAQTLYPEEEWNEANIEAFMGEFEFRLNEQMPGYDIYWDTSRRQDKKEPKLPGVVVNYMNPWQNLIFKHNLRQIEQYGELLTRWFGPYGIVMDLMLSRICHNLTERLEYHERQLIGLMEATQRFEYTPDIPMGLVDPTTDLLYLSHYTHSKDPNLANGMAKRKMLRTEQEKTRDKVLRATARKKSLAYNEIGRKFLVARSEEDGRFRGIYGLATKPWGKLALHVNASTSAYKIAERYSTDFLGFLARTLVPSYWAIRLFMRVYIYVYVPPAYYESVIRTWRVNETALEGELKGMVDEAIAGRMQLPLSNEELLTVRSRLRATQINPYELDLNEEAPIIRKNLELLKKALESEKQGQATFSAENLVPLRI